MKASINSGGLLSVEPENPLEEYALKQWKYEYDNGEAILYVGFEVEHSNDDWYDWGEGSVNTPYLVASSDRVEVRFRDGKVRSDFAGMFRWHHNDDPNDIVAYRRA